VKRILTVVLFALVILGQANLSHGAGFLIYEHGAAAMAMAGAFISVANDPSAIWHNPAGIAFLKGTQFSLGTTLIWSKASVDLVNWPVPSERKWDQISQTFYPSSVYLTQSVGDKVTLGFGFFSPYGLGAKWPAENEQGKFPLRYLGYEDDMKTFFFNPTVGVKLTDQLSVGVGVSYIYSTVEFKLVERKNFGAYGAYDIPASMKGNGSSFNFNAGLLYHGENFSLGFNYRSGFTIDYEGDLTLDTSALLAPLKPYVPNTAKGKTSFRFPHILGAGASVNLTDKLLLSADAHYILWSRFDEYEVEFSEQDQGLPLEAMVVEEKFKDSWIWRAGLQYMVTPKFALRGGFLWDETPQPADTMDPLLPDAKRYAITAGLGYTFGKVVLDITYHHEVFSDRTAPNRYIEAYQFGPINLGEGNYKTKADLLGISLSFVF
jgi:long-chain fatty acid transport protein